MKNMCIFLLIIILIKPCLADITCDDTVDYKAFKAIYEPYTYTCAPGEFLPANTFMCKPCPSGYVCNGGTFNFDPNMYQGIVLDLIPESTINYVCASNFTPKLRAVYEPNTITINWDDGTNTTQNTCVYGQSITLPPEPVRPGYKFGGWRVKRN